MAGTTLVAVLEQEQGKVFTGYHFKAYHQGTTLRRSRATRNKKKRKNKDNQQQEEQWDDNIVLPTFYGNSNIILIE